jgi:hypothetical protein
MSGLGELSSGTHGLVFALSTSAVFALALWAFSRR